jgi:hypothetical protein
VPWLAAPEAFDWEMKGRRHRPARTRSRNGVRRQHQQDRDIAEVRRVMDLLHNILRTPSSNCRVSNPQSTWVIFCTRSRQRQSTRPYSQTASGMDRTLEITSASPTILVHFPTVKVRVPVGPTAAPQHQRQYRFRPPLQGRASSAQSDPGFYGADRNYSETASLSHSSAPCGLVMLNAPSGRCKLYRVQCLY